MSAVALDHSTDPVTLILEGIGGRTRAQFAGVNCTVGRSRVVHAVAQDEWIAGVELPVPACRVGVSGWRLDRIAPSRNDVTCLRCLRAIRASRAVPAPTDVHQLQLDI